MAVDCYEKLERRWRQPKQPESKGLFSIAAAGVIIIANWQTCDEMGAGTGRVGDCQAQPGGRGGRCFLLRTSVASRAKRGRPTTRGSCPIPTSARTRTWGAAAGVITITNWQTCDDMGMRGTGRGSRWCGGILVMGLKRGRGGGNAAAGWGIGRGRRGRRWWCGG